MSTERRVAPASASFPLRPLRPRSLGAARVHRRLSWNLHTELRKQHKRGHYVPDLASGGLPVLPPIMRSLSLIEGGKADMLPAAPAPGRRRKGGEDK